MLVTNGAARVMTTLSVLLLCIVVASCGKDTTVDAQAARTPAASNRSASATASANTGLASDTPPDSMYRADAPALPATVSGTLEPHARALLRAELSGAVRTLSVKVGERVSAGRELATLDVPTVRSAMAAAEAQVIAQEAALRQVQRERDRVSQLLAVGGVSTTEMDDWDSRVQAAEAALQLARAQRANAAADVARLSIRAPFDGIVEQRVATQGSMVQVGDELLRIIDPRLLELEAAVAMSHAHRARPGARVALRVSGLTQDSVIARVVRVAPALDPVTRQVRVTIRVPNSGGHIPAGAWAEGTLSPDSTATNARGHRVAGGGR